MFIANPDGLSARNDLASPFDTRQASVAGVVVKARAAISPGLATGLVASLGLVADFGLAARALGPASRALAAGALGSRRRLARCATVASTAGAEGEGEDRVGEDALPEHERTLHQWMNAPTDGEYGAIHVWRATRAIERSPRDAASAHSC